MSKSGISLQFRYNHAGLRTQKIVTENGVTTTTEYIYHGKLLTHMVQGNDQLHFFYDAQSRPAMVDFNGTKYTYPHNLQGDVVGMLDSTGALVVEYKYDAWGKPVGLTGSMAATLGTVNHFRYRGYVWDEETGLYYLRSRYYKPITARFLNSDVKLCGVDLSASTYCYCRNSPVGYADFSGFESFQVTLNTTAPTPTPTPADPEPVPSRPFNWKEGFEWRYYLTAAGSSYYYGKPNSYRAWQNSDGEWFERWYDGNGEPLLDRHWTNHGNDKKHPFVPHDEDWKDDGKGHKTIDTRSARPSPQGVKKPKKSTYNHEFSINTDDVIDGISTAVMMLFAVGLFVISGCTVSVPIGVL